MPSATRLLSLTLALLAASAAAAHADGELDPSFATDGVAIADLGSSVDHVAGVQLAPGGRIVVVGDTLNPGGRDLVVAAFTAAGIPDPSFGGTGRVVTDFGGDEGAAGLAVADDGSIVAIGTRTKDGVIEVVLARYHADGSLDTGFNGTGRRVLTFTDGADNLGRAVLIDPDGRIVVAGTRTTASGSVIAVARLLPDGSLDTSLNANGKRFVDFGIDNGTNAFGEAVGLQDDGKIVVAGTRVSAKGSDFAVARLNADGSFDQSFAGSGKRSVDFGGTDEAHALTITPDGRIAVAGTRTTASGSDFAVAVLLDDGSPDPAFKGNGKATTDFSGDEFGYAIAAQNDGQLVVAGERSGSNGRDFVVARYDMTGTPDPALDGDGKVRVDLPDGRDDSATGVALQDDGRIVVAGTTTAAGNSDLGLVRLLSSVPGSPGALENPSPGSHQSGIGVISGWLCSAPSVTVRIDGAAALPTAYGTPRSDTIQACGDANNGFGLLFNWSLLGDGRHVIRAFAGTQQLAIAHFDVQTLGTTFLRGATGTFTVDGFPTAASSIDLGWSEALQGFVMQRFAAKSAAASVPPAGTSAAAVSGMLENPTPDSFQSGIGLISGWVCDASTVQVRLDNLPAIPAAYGTPRGDTQAACGDTDNGFGLLFNWGLLGDGVHKVDVRADGRVIGTVNVTVTTPGTSFLRGASGTFTLPDFPAAGHSVDVLWEEGQQKFVILNAR